ncbi:M14 metallopeptidase family protein [Maribacter sp. 1_MG-2023]|uniref:M14 family metallopeptidase n=1 Tax=Maribacter sp. 1_MG-2023 TaxID=3062677 RepID=UPI0026E1CB8F|nr:M14 metallopeptidase family protein [Maribacter sp. 1_MG-2023]MDO6473216.1 M14 family metallopeptidase [Maribacter sp. 1_MG-2023]
MKDLDYNKIMVPTISRRYINYDHINEFLKTLPTSFKIEVVEESVRKESIKSITFGSGTNKVLMWSQMHGNESTTTKAVVDLLSYLKQDIAEVLEISKSCTLKIIPILSPDGARDYTRVNANGIDLNRDAQDLSQPESRVLKAVYDKFKPDYCFNLHDQRTIFNVGDTSKPATVSFLAPAFDQDRNNSPSRTLSMQLIAAMNDKLQKEIPGQVGRYDDGFNANCVGDAFQMRETPTILFESGHYPGDYDRDKTRVLIYKAILKGIQVISKGTVSDYTVEQYLSIPENGKQFVDILVVNPNYIENSITKTEIVPIQYKEVLKEGEIVFKPQLHHFDKMPKAIFGHKTLNCNDENDILWLKEKDLLQLLS